MDIEQSVFLNHLHLMYSFEQLVFFSDLNVTLAKKSRVLCQLLPQKLIYMFYKFHEDSINS